MTKLTGLLRSTLVVAAVVAAAGVVPAAVTPDRIVDRPDESTFAVVVVDRQTGATVAEQNPHIQFRSASLVKLLVALDYFDKRSPDAEIPEEDRELLGSMLRSSDNRAASVLWVQQGWETIVERMVALLGLEDTEPPTDRRIWGNTAISAADVVRTYEYLLDEADPRARDFILGHLRNATRCAVDGRNQYFGIPRAVPEPTAVKQGWSGFGEVPPGQECTPTPPSAVEPADDDEARKDSSRSPAGTGGEAGVDLVREAMHTSGTIGDGDETIMVVLSLHPDGTPYEAAARRVTKVTRALHLATCSSCRS